MQAIIIQTVSKHMQWTVDNTICLLTTPLSKASHLYCIHMMCNALSADPSTADKALVLLENVLNAVWSYNR